MGTPATASSAPEGVRPAAGAGRRGGGAAGRSAAITLGVIAAVVAAGYAAFALRRFATFQDGSDLLYFDQAVRSYAHFHLGISDFFGRYWGHPAGVPVLSDHFVPMLIALAPLYWFAPYPQTLLVAQSVLLALAIGPLWVFARRAFGGGRYGRAAAYCVVVAYALSWPVAEAAGFDFHEVAFAPVLMAVMLERFQAGRLRGALLALGALLLVKEDMGLFAAGVGLYLLAARPALITRQRLVGLLLLVGGVLDTWVVTRYVIPAFGGSPDHYWAYPTFGSTIPGAALHVIGHPASSLLVLVTPGVKAGTIVLLLATFGFLPLLSPITLAALPLLLERMFATTHSIWWGTGSHYNAFVVVVLLCGAVDGAARLDRWIRRVLIRRVLIRRAQPPAPAGSGVVALGCAGLMVIAAAALLPRFTFGQVLQPGYYRQQAVTSVEAAAIARVPSGVTVETISGLGPPLSARDTVLFWNNSGPLWAPWVIAQVSAGQFTFPTIASQRDRVALLERDGYQVVYQRMGYVVLHRVRAGRARLAG